MPWWGVQIRGDYRKGKMGDASFHTINCFISSNSSVCSFISCIELIGKGAIASHIHVIKPFNLLNSIKWCV